MLGSNFVPDFSPFTHPERSRRLGRIPEAESRSCRRSNPDESQGELIGEGGTAVSKAKRVMLTAPTRQYIAQYELELDAKPSTR